MDAILLREAGGLGDILQVGSAVPMLTRAGYRVHLYTMLDASIVALAKLIPGIAHVHTLHMTTTMRRARGAINYWAFPYLTSAMVHVRGCSRLPNRNRLFDMFCPAWENERDDLRSGQLPQMSRAQAFVRAIGHAPGSAKPTRLRVPHDPFPGVPNGYVVISPWSRDPARSVGAGVYSIIEAIVRLAPVVVLDYSTAADHKHGMQNVWWYPQDFANPDRAQAVHDTVRLVAYAAAVVTVDTFALHVAGSFAKPVVLLEGPTVATSVAKHYSRVVACPAALDDCKGCYYMMERGFVRSCRDRGCRVIDSATPGDVVASLEQVCSSCVSS